MKISLNQKEHGGVLITALVISAVMGVVLASFITLTTTRNATTMRSQAWNSAIPVLETGIEEAMAHIHADTNNPQANGWTKVDINGKTVYQKRRDLAPDVGYCLVTISNTITGPVIYSRAFVPAPLGRGKISRLVRVTTAASGPFPYGLLAQRNVNFNGGGYFVKSFNSEDPNYSTNGHFIFSRSLANARVMSVLGTTDAVNVGNASIFGNVGTGAGGTVAMGPGGIVGDSLWIQDPINVGKIQPGHNTDDVNVYIPDNTLPPGRWFPPLVNTSVAGTNYAFVLTGGEYYMDRVSLSGKSVIYVGGDSSLHITRSLAVSGGASIYIAPNSSLKIYVDGIASIGGGGIVNSTGVAKNLCIFGTPTCTGVGYNGSADFIGVINAPQADVAFGGGANIVGAVIGNNITLGGSGYFVYDEALSKGDYTFTITSYREL
jgi:hypothetical protein